MLAFSLYGLQVLLRFFIIEKSLRKAQPKFILTGAEVYSWKPYILRVVLLHCL